MSEMWNRTLVYLGLREEPEEMYDELPASFDAEDDPHAAHAQERPNASRRLAGAGGRSGQEPARGDETRDRSRDRATDADGAGRGRGGRGRDERDRASESNVRALRTGDPTVRPMTGAVPRSARVALVEVLAFEDVEAVGSRYRTGQPVLFEVAAGDRGTGQRVVDFVSGLTYVSRGRLTKVGSRAFLLVPDGVEVAEEEQERLRGLGFRLPAVTNA